MGTPTPDKLRTFYPSKYLTVDGEDLLQLTADAGGSVNTIVDAALTQVDDYWNGAVGWFKGDTVTTDLQGKFFHVKDFDDASDTLTLARDLPAAPVAGDTFTLVLGGCYRSSQEMFGLALGGELPELKTINGTNITGLTIKKASSRLGEGTLSISYTNAVEEMFIKMDAGNYGIGLDVSADVTDGIIYAEDGQAWIQVDIVAASLPGSDQVDTFTTSKVKDTIIPTYEGYETNNGVGGKTRYHLITLKNTDASETMVDLASYLSKPIGPPVTIDGGESLGLGEDSMLVTDPTSWPSKGYWIKNTTQNDCRYVKERSGSTIKTLAVDWAALNFDQGSTQINQGDAISDQTTGATAIVDQVTVTSGTYGGGDAAGSMIIRLIVGTFNDNNNILVSAATVAVCDGNSALGYRGLIGVTWNATDNVELMPDVDMGFDKPTAQLYENPSEETIAPGGVVFSDASNQSTSVSLSSLDFGKLHGIWIREWILEGHRSRDQITADTNYFWS